MVMMLRVGQGFDVHALVPGRRLRLAGVEIDSELGLLGHSDADVILHAIADALLGATGLGDIGQVFPDHDARYRDADSRVLLRDIVHRVRAAGWQVQNVDCTLICERPRIAPHVAAMRANIALDLEVAVDAVSVKGKTSESLGFTGRGEGIAVFAVALLQRP